MARRHARGSRVRAIGHPRSYLLPHWISTLQSESPATETVTGLCLTYRAGDGTRTRDLLLGKQILYQLSYSRNCQHEKPALYELHYTQGHGESPIAHLAPR